MQEFENGDMNFFFNEFNTNEQEKLLKQLLENDIIENEIENNNHVPNLLDNLIKFLLSWAIRESHQKKSNAIVEKWLYDVDISVINTLSLLCLFMCFFFLILF